MGAVARPIEALVKRRYSIPDELELLEGEERSKGLKRYAYRMFLDYNSSEAVHEALNIPIRTLKHWIHQGLWTTQRAKLQQLVGEESMKRHLITLDNITSDSLELIRDTIAAYKRTGTDLQDALLISRIFMNLDKMLRLAQGQPTDVIGIQMQPTALPPKTAAEVARIIAADPFTSGGRSATLPQDARSVKGPPPEYSEAEIVEPGANEGSGEGLK